MVLERFENQRYDLDTVKRHTSKAENKKVKAGIFCFSFVTLYQTEDFQGFYFHTDHPIYMISLLLPENMAIFNQSLGLLPVIYLWCGKYCVKKTILFHCMEPYIF